MQDNRQKMKNLILISLIISIAWGCGKKQPSNTTPDIIPVPLHAKMTKGNFEINRKTKILITPADENLKSVAGLLQEEIEFLTGKKVDFSPLQGEQPKNSILLKLDGSISVEVGLEGYKISVQPSGIVIRAPQPAGLFYGIQTLYQLLPPEAFSNSKDDPGLKDIELSVPCLEMTDKPSFAWRGMHLDVSRHFFPKEFIKKYIDLIAMHKMNVFHWHLTDDNGWRIQIDRYPLLTDVAAWRADREGTPWTERRPQQPGEPATYGGFYTKDDIREIVAYASKRFVTIVPEIEMPGHTSEVFAAYPEYSCSGKKTTVQTGSYWPNTDIFCAGNEGTFIFIQNILDEVIDLFPSPYIHIGGDEADKTAWRSCPDCQSRIMKEGLRGEDELQSYFVKRIAAYIKSKGKRMIGWDEILEGGLAPDAAVMSWRGFEGGIEAAGQGHRVVMCPTSHCYFDYYQGNPDYQPPAIGGLTTLRKVYSFTPIPSELPTGERKLILGGQGNLWTEYIDNPAHAEYMVLPRMTALAEVLWSDKNNLEWDDFKNRLQTQFKRFEAMGANYCLGSGKVDISAVFDTEGKPYCLKLETEMTGSEIYYTMDGYTPDKNSFKYKGPVGVGNSIILKAIAFKEGKKLDAPAEYKITYHNAIGKDITNKTFFSERYAGGGVKAPVDGIRGSLDHSDGNWQGYYGVNADLTIELGDGFTFNTVTTTFLLDQKRWIFYPDTVRYFISDDGVNFQKMAAIRHSTDMNTVVVQTNDFTAKINRPLKAKYLRLEAVNIGVCPDWHPGKGEKAWLFLDEIVIN